MYYEVTYSLQTRKYCDVLNEDKVYPFTTQCMELIVAQIQTLWGGYLSSKQPPDAAGNASGYTEFPWQDSLDLYRVSRCVMSQEESIRQRELGSLVPRVLEGELGRVGVGKRRSGWGLAKGVGMGRFLARPHFWSKGKGRATIHYERRMTPREIYWLTASSNWIECQQQKHQWAK